ncbi:chromate transporter [Phyllobacterium lublinensis]|uniref:chromate transporter n=1 Tax=Phyllobacterium lublinensis TaxID=2875708 RepID=UPI001CCA9E9B|nr:chromate transporter [Phyllobacterium sp. 2063]MBZ9653739.1 chromate transporter [Phyllobacterium sp. 2063]
MKDEGFNLLIKLFLVFAPLSLSAFGGGISVLSAIQHQVVDVYHWTTGPEFLELFAIARAAPGPGSMMLTTLIGLKVAGIPGALVATIGMFLPSSILCIACAAIWGRYRTHPVMRTLEKALLPIGAGLLIAGVTSIGMLVSTSLGLLAIAAASAAACLLLPGLHPLIVIGAGAVANLLISLLFG